MGEDTLIKANATYSMAEVNLIGAKFKEAESGADDAIKIFQELNSQVGEGNCLVMKAQLYIFTGRFQDALAAADSALEIAQQIGDTAMQDQASKLQEKVRGAPMPMQGLQPAFQDQQLMAAEPEVSSVVEEVKPKGLDPLMVG